MKLCIDLTSLAFHLSGIERYALNISIEWLMTNQNDEFYLLFCNQIHPDFATILSKRENVHSIIIQSKEGKLNKLLLFQYRIPREMMRIKADCFAFFAFTPPLFYRKANVIKTIHDIGFFDCPQMWTWYASVYGRIMIKAAVIHSGKIIVPSHTTKQRLTSRLNVNSERVSVVCPAVDERFNPTALSLEEEERVRHKYSLPRGPYLLSLSTLEPRKNLELLIRVYDQMCQNETAREELVLAGRKGWKIDHLMEDVDNITVQHIHFTGFIEDNDLPAVYKMAKLFIFPSLYEGFGIPPLEAIACGTPALVSDLPVFQEIFEDAVAYFRSDDPEDLQRMLTKEHKAIPEKLAEQAAKYSWRRSAELLDQIVRRS